MKLAKFTAGANLPARWGRKGFTLVEIMIVVLIIGILLAIAVPNFIKARETSRTKSCVANLKQIDAAVEQWAMDNKQSQGASVSLSALIGAGSTTTYIKNTPSCPSGGTYSDPETVGTAPTCSTTATGNDVERMIRSSSARSSVRPARSSVASSRVSASTLSRVTRFGANQLRRERCVARSSVALAASDCATCIGSRPWSRRRSTISASLAASSSPLDTSPEGVTAR